MKSLTNSKVAISFFVVLSGALLSCGGGGKKPPQPPPAPLLVIESIDFEPINVSVSTAVVVSATYNNPSLAQGREKVWAVSGGSLSSEKPDFGLMIRNVAGIKETGATVSTKKDSVYWFTPSSPGDYTVTLTVAGATKKVSVRVLASPLVLDVLSEEDGGRTVIVRASNVSNLYQAGFRVIYDTTLYSPTSVASGSFLGSQADILFIGLTNQAGFVPIAITRKGNAGGVSGSGELARVAFRRVSNTSGLMRRGSILGVAGFELGFFILLDYEGNIIGGG